LFSDNFPLLVKNNANFIYQCVKAKPSATTFLNAHEKNPAGTKTSLHKETSRLYVTLLSQKANISKTLPDLVNQQDKDQRAENRKLLVPIIDTIILCGRMGIPLRFLTMNL